MTRAGKLVAALAVGAIVLVVFPDFAIAEQVECPSCWRMIDEGPCRCPHCNTDLPDRVCSAEERRASPGRGTGESSKARQPSTERRRSPTKSEPRRQTQERRNETRRKQPPRPTAEAESDEPNARSVAASQGFDTPTGPSTPDRVDEPDDEVEDEFGDEIIDDLDDELDDELDDDEYEEEEEEDEGSTPLVPYRNGPAFLVGYRYFGLYDWIGEGHSHAFTIEGYPIRRYVPWLRVGLGLDVGFRQLEQHTDWIMRGFLSLGVQYPRRVTPYGSFNVGGGTAYRKRFGQGLTDGMFAVGFDVGATFGLSRTFSADLSIGYLYMSFADLGYHSPNVRVSIGW